MTSNKSHLRPNFPSDLPARGKKSHHLVCAPLFSLVRNIDKNHNAGENSHDEEDNKQYSVQNESDHAPLGLVVLVGVGADVALVDLLVELPHVRQQLAQHGVVVREVRVVVATERRVVVLEVLAAQAVLHRVPAPIDDRVEEDVA